MRIVEGIIRPAAALGGQEFGTPVRILGAHWVAFVFRSPSVDAKQLSAATIEIIEDPIPPTAAVWKNPATPGYSTRGTAITARLDVGGEIMTLATSNASSPEVISFGFARYNITPATSIDNLEVLARVCFPHNLTRVPDLTQLLR